MSSLSLIVLPPLSNEYVAEGAALVADEELVKA
jgi:hypothetical protein